MSYVPLGRISSKLEARSSKLYGEFRLISVEPRPYLQSEHLDWIHSDIMYLEPPGHRIYADVPSE